MNLLHDAAYFLGGALLTNAVPHGVAGLTGTPFRTPFANPPGRGLSSPRINVLWTAVNLGLAWLLLSRVGAFDLHSLEHMLALGLGALLMGLHAGRPGVSSPDA